MKKLLLLSLLFTSAISFSQNIAINSTGALPVASAMLDITSTTSGLLIPRMTTAQRTAIAAPATSLLVFDTTLNAFYYWNGAAWIPLLSSSSGWMLTGNSLAGTEFMGSTNAQPVKFYSNNTERVRVLSTGEVIVNATAPVAGDQFSAYGAVTAAAGYATAVNGTGLFGSSGTLSGGTGIWGFANAPGSTLAFAGWATNNDPTGMALVGAGTGVTSTFPTGGAGGAFSGIPLGMAAYSGNTNTNGNAAGYFAGNTSTVTGQYAYVSTRNAGIWYKILGTGSVSSILRNQKSADKVVFCPEAMEILLQDYGVGELKNGRAHITIDPVLAENITVNDKHPLRVYITLKGECNGVYVTNETNEGFDVVELGKGTSNVKFNYQIVANRADEINDTTGEVLSNNADARLPDAPGMVPSLTRETPKKVK